MFASLFDQPMQPDEEPSKTLIRATNEMPGWSRSEIQMGHSGTTRLVIGTPKISRGTMLLPHECRVDSSNLKPYNVGARKDSRFLETLARLKAKPAARLERPVLSAHCRTLQETFLFALQRLG